MAAVSAIRAQGPE